MSVVARPVVLAPLALRAPGTLNAGRGASQTSRRARRRVLRLRVAELLQISLHRAEPGCQAFAFSNQPAGAELHGTGSTC
jgi:hypothetical protein